MLFACLYLPLLHMHCAEATIECKSGLPTVFRSVIPIAIVAAIATFAVTQEDHFNRNEASSLTPGLRVPGAN